MGENQLKIFDRLVEMLFKFSNMEMSFNNGIKSISVVLHDNWVQYQGEPFTIDEGFELYDKEKRLKVLLDMLNVLDPGDLVRHLILDYGDEGYEEFDTRLSSALKNGHLETSESCRLRMLVLNSVSLGTAFVHFG